MRWDIVIAGAVVVYEIWKWRRARQPEEDIRQGVEGLIGQTPLVELKTLSAATGCRILGKAEFLNPGGSPKDRVALAILEAASARLASHGSVYEGTVGSTGISLAMLCRAKGYHAHICMPSDQGQEKIHQLEALGAVVERVPPASIIDQDQFVNKARAQAERTGGVFADQFENEANWQAHYRSTGPEIYAQCAGRIDAFVCGAGTGGLITGIGRYLRSRIPQVRIVLADPQGSGLFNKVMHGVMYDDKEREGTRRRHQIDSLVEGIGLNRLTANFEAGLPLISSAERVTDEEVVAMSRYLVDREGLFVGSSSCVNVCAAVRVARTLPPNSTIVTILCDPGHRHLSKLYNDEYLRSRGIDNSYKEVGKG